MPISMRRGGSYAWYFASTSGALAIPLLVERVWLQPTLAVKLESESPELFGTWVWFLNTLILISVPLSSGATFPITRGLFEAGDERRLQLVRFASLAVWAIILPLQAVVILTVSWYLSELPLYLLFLIGIAIGGGVVSHAESELTFSVLRVFRYFGLQLLLRIGYAVLIALAVVLLIFTEAPSAELILSIVAVVYSVATLYTVCTGVICRRMCMAKAQGQPVRATSTERRLSIREFGLSAVGATVVNFCDQAMIYFPRILVGFLFDMRQVGVFVAGTSVAALCLMPVTMIGTTFLTLLSGKSQLGWTTFDWLKFFAAVLVLSISVGLAVWWTRDVALSLLYPDYRQEALPICGWISLATSLMTVQRVIRPLVMRYLPLKNTIIFSMMNVVCMTAFVLFLAPNGLIGIAQAFAFGAFCQVATWLLYLLWGLRFASAESGLSATS